MEARMLPHEGDLSPEQLNHVRKKVDQWIIQNNHDHAYIDAQLKCARGATISFVQNKYRYDETKFARRIDRWLNQKDMGYGSMPSAYVPTRIAKNILSTLQQIKARKSMGSIVGPSGVSKSMMREACVSGLIEGCVAFELSETDRSMGQMLKRMAYDLGGHKSFDAQRAMFFLRDYFMETDILIIIDEAHYLSKRAMNALRDLHKSTKCPICLMGTQDLLETIDDFNEFHGQMKSLFTFNYNITVESKSDGRPLYTVDEVMKFAKSMSIKLNISGACELTDLANTLGWGGLRSASHVLINAASLARGRVVTDKTINSALKKMEGADGFARTKNKAELYKKMAVA
jgi:hypothetical protein